MLANPGSLTRAQWLRFVARKHGVVLLVTNRLWKGRAQRVSLVATPEPPALDLARRGPAELLEGGVGGTGFSLL